MVLTLVLTLVFSGAAFAWDGNGPVDGGASINSGPMLPGGSWNELEGRIADRRNGYHLQRAYAAGR